MEKTVMVFGVGETASWTLEFLARTEGIDRIVTSDISKKGLYRTNGAAASSTHQGFSKKFEFHQNDVGNIDTTARLLEEIRPNVILSLLTHHSLIALRPAAPGTRDRHAVLREDIRDKIWAAGFGPFLPWQVLLPAKLMEAVKKSGIQTHVVNCSDPGVTGPVIWKHLGFGPTIGLGTFDVALGRIKKYVSMREGVSVRDVLIYFVGDYPVYQRISKEPIPFFLKILLGDRDITKKYDAKWLISEKDCMPMSNAGNYSSTAASAVKNVLAILGDTNELTYAPSPKGLIGGYPVRIGAKGAEVELPQELTLDQAIKINEDMEKFDGIEKIEDDGTVVYTDKTYSIMKELGYDCKKLPFDEIESRSEELEALEKDWLALK
jgi:hypothetical protein